VSERLDRRDFLERAALAAGTVGIVPRWALAGSSDPRLKELARSIQGSVVSPGNSGYRAARILFNPRFDGIRPRAVVLAESSADVAKAILWARKYGIPLAPRAGGHSYGGYSTTNGLVVDVTRMSAVSVDSAARTATVGAGARLIDVYSKLWAHRVGIPAGSCPTVGVGGHALGGGVGFSSRRLGTTCDNVLAVRIVTADGRVLDCDQHHHPDLYWACRGGGGRNFGIATSFRFKVHPVGNVSYFTIEWPWEMAPSVIQAWQGFGPHAPDALFSTLNLRSGSGVAPRIIGAGQLFGSKAQLSSVLAPLVDTDSPTRVSLYENTFLHAAEVWAGCSDDIDACHLAPAGKLMRDTYKGKSDYALTPISAAGIQQIVNALEARTAISTPGRGILLLDSYGGAINRVPKAATAFVHRDALFSMQYLAYWDSPAQAAANLAWIRAFYAAMRPYVSGFAYQNYIDPDLKSWARAYYGSNLPRLVAVKKAYDPGNVFRFAQSIPTHL
jgi:FAD/FMN-containing dehydrogenase